MGQVNQVCFLLTLTTSRKKSLKTKWMRDNCSKCSTMMISFMHTTGMNMINLTSKSQDFLTKDFQESLQQMLSTQRPNIQLRYQPQEKVTKLMSQAWCKTTTLELQLVREFSKLHTIKRAASSVKNYFKTQILGKDREFTLVWVGVFLTINKCHNCTPIGNLEDSFILQQVSLTLNKKKWNVKSHQEGK